MSLFQYIAKRLLASVPVLFAALLITFILTDMMPGDPIMLMLGNRFNPVTYESLMIHYGFWSAPGVERPVMERFILYIGNIFKGDWGEGVGEHKFTPVWDIIAERFPRTMELALFAVAFAGVVGILSGVASAKNRNKGPDTLIRGISLIGVAMPVFFLGIILQLVFAYYLDVLPMQGYVTNLLPPPPKITNSLLIDSLLAGDFIVFWDHLQHMVLPVIALGLISMASITRQTRSSMLEVLEQDYIRTARAKGCPERSVIQQHALRNSLIPTTTIIGLNVAGLLGGAVMTETVFSYKGIGMTLITAISQQDYFLINAIVFLMTLIFIIVNLITDLAYGVLDPRIRYE
jgi:ABC-type dipeptide/oligopeptide/nickel transport system permease component